jgi:WD40 repeat protein
MNEKSTALLAGWSLTLLVSTSCTNVRTSMTAPELPAMRAADRQVTTARYGHIVANTAAWSPDSLWIVYDVRSDAAGSVFDGDRIEMVNIETGEVRTLYESRNGAHCGVVTFHPREHKVAFILGPENPTPDWEYSFTHRQGVIVDAKKPGQAINLDARDLTPPFTPGALRGGTHVHIWDAAGDWVSSTYEDHVLAQLKDPSPEHDLNQRNIAVSIPGKTVRVSKDHPRNHDGEYFTVLVTQTTASPTPGSDEITRACEEGWIGTNGYVRQDGTRQHRALAFQGSILTAKGETIAEVFIADLPEDLTEPGDGPLCGTETRAPYPPRNIAQRRLTFTVERKFPGLQEPRHWLRSSPDGSRIAFLMKDDAGVAQLWTVSPNGGSPTQLTRNPTPIASTFTWSPDSRWIAHAMDNSVCVSDSEGGETKRLTRRSDDATAPRPEACVFSPDGKKIAFVRRIKSGNETFNQVHILFLEQ